MKEYPTPNPEEDMPAGSGYPDAPEVNSPEETPVEGMDVFPEGETPDASGFSVDERLVSPELSDHISRDEDAYGFHGMPEPGEINQPFDLSVLDDPELDDPEESDAYFSYSPSAEREGPEELPGDFLAEAEADIQPDGSEMDPEDDYREVDDEEFQALLDSQPEQEPIPAHDRPARKGRPRRKKGEGLFGIPNILVTLVWAAIVLAIGVTLGRMLWVCATDVLAFGREDKSVTITVYESDTIDQITDKLYKGGLIRYPGLFKLYASFAVDEGEICPGIWDLNTRYYYHALVKMMSPSSTRAVVKLTIPEGYTCRQIFQLMEENKVCTFVDIGSYAASGELKDYWFLEGVARGDFYSLEGYLFPDTYEFYKNDSPRNVLEKMLDNFDARFSQEMRDQLPALNEHISDLMRRDGRSEEYIAAHQLSMNDLVIVASMIEKETSGNKESPTIASVIYNRLFNWGDTPAYLNIDASIVYALDGKTDLTAEDLKVDSPYNTYYHTGLTPTPISNPGLASLQAALNPASTKYYYYVLDPMAGSHIFSTTLEEHEANRAALAKANAAG